MRPGAASAMHSNCSFSSTTIRTSARIRNIPAPDIPLLLSDRRHRQHPLVANIAENREFLESLAYTLSNKFLKLNSKNYTTWKRDIELHLRSTCLWDTVTTDAPNPMTPDRQQRDVRCLIEIVG